MASAAVGSLPQIGFKNDIQPILDENCVACHQQGSAQAGLVLEDGLSWAALVGRKSSEQGKLLVKPGAPADSYLLDKLAAASTVRKGSIMPPGEELEAGKIALISQWISDGARND